MDSDNLPVTSLFCRQVGLLLLYDYRYDRTATEAARNICCTVSEGVVGRTTQRIFTDGFFELDDIPRLGRLSELDSDRLKRLIKQNRCLIVRCLAEQLGYSHVAMDYWPN